MAYIDFVFVYYRDKPVVANQWHTCHSQLFIIIESFERFIITPISDCFGGR